MFGRRRTIVGHDLGIAGLTGRSRPVSIVPHHSRGPSEDEPERLWRGAMDEAEQRVADHCRRGARHAAACFRIGPSDRAEVDDDVANIRPRGADGLRDDAFAIDPASYGGGDRIRADGNPRLLPRLATARGPGWCGGAKQCSLVARRALHIVTLGASLATNKAGVAWLRLHVLSGRADSLLPHAFPPRTVVGQYQK